LSRLLNFAIAVLRNDLHTIRCFGLESISAQGSPPPRFGRIVTRFESFGNPKSHFGTACEKSNQRGIGVYYVIDNAARDSRAVERVEAPPAGEDGIVGAGVAAQGQERPADDVRKEHLAHLAALAQDR
jgi:hypothetical protein